MLNFEQRSEIDNLIRTVGQDYILPHYHSLQDDDIHKKKDGTLVTNVDIGAERRLVAGLNAILPGSLFLAEEAFEDDRTTIHNLEAEDAPVWVIDPLDGTKSFVDGKDNFGTMIALVYQGKTIASYLYDICSDTLISIHVPESVAQNGEQMDSPIDPDRPIRGEIASHVWNSPMRHIKLKNLKTGLEFSANTGPRIDSYMKFLRGEIDFLVFEKTPPWDHLPGLAMLESMGCSVETWDRNAPGLTDTDRGLVITRTPELMDSLQEEIVTAIKPNKPQQQSPTTSIQPMRAYAYG